MITLSTLIIKEVGLIGSVLLGEFLCEYKKQKDFAKEGWFLSTISDVERRTGIKRDRQRSTQKILENKKLIECKNIGLPPRRWIRINFDLIKKIDISYLNHFNSSKDFEYECPESQENQQIAENPLFKERKIRYMTENHQIAENPLFKKRKIRYLDETQENQQIAENPLFKERKIRYLDETQENQQIAENPLFGEIQWYQRFAGFSQISRVYIYNIYIYITIGYYITSYNNYMCIYNKYIYTYNQVRRLDDIDKKLFLKNKDSIACNYSGSEPDVSSNVDKRVDSLPKESTLMPNLHISKANYVPLKSKKSKKLSSPHVETSIIKSTEGAKISTYSEDKPKKDKLPREDVAPPKKRKKQGKENLYDVVVNFTKNEKMRELLFDHINMASINNKKCTAKLYKENLLELKKNVPNFSEAKEIILKATKNGWRYVWYPPRGGYSSPNRWDG